MELLPVEIYGLIVRYLRLQNMICLMAVSQRIRTIILFPNNWHVILDSKVNLYRFINKVFKCKSIAYPCSYIESMYIIDYGNPELLSLDIGNRANFYEFYRHFPNYRCLYLNDDIEPNNYYNLSQIQNIFIYGHSNTDTITISDYVTLKNITKICAPYWIFDMKIVQNYPLLENLYIEIPSHNANYLKMLRLKHLGICGGNYDHIIKNLPETIESLIFSDLDSYEKAQLINNLYTCKNLRYLRVYVYLPNLSITLTLDMIYIFILTDRREIKIFVDNVKNIIIDTSFLSLDVRVLWVSSKNAKSCQISKSCQIAGIPKHQIIFDLPNCDLISIVDGRNSFSEKIEWIT